MTTLLANIVTPDIEYRQLSPILIVLGAAVISVLVEAFLPRATRRSLQLAITFGPSPSPVSPHTLPQRFPSTVPEGTICGKTDGKNPKRSMSSEDHARRFGL